VIALTALCLGLASSTSAQVKPYFLVIVDTSGSMGWCSGGSAESLGTNDCSCHVGNDCNAAFQINRCGFPRNRLGDAKCSLQRIIDGVGSDAVFGLMQFEHPCSATCQDGGDLSSLSNCDPNTNFDDDAYDDGQLLASFDLTTPGNANIREWVDGECTGSCMNNYTRELTTGWWTPIGRSLQRADEFLHGLPSSGFLFPTNGDIQPTSPLAGDAALSCRKVSVILLTDGAETCAGNAAAHAASLFAAAPSEAPPANKSIPTYVIGFGTGGDFSPAALNEIAQAGGTDAPPSGGDGFYAAADEAGLSVALAEIVARSLVTEVCNGLDDDCDGKVDEGLPSGQPGNAAQSGALFCDGEAKRSEQQNDQVRARPDFAADFANSTPISERVVCGYVRDTCDHAHFDDDCDGRLDEDASNLNDCGVCPDQQDVCDGVDNDCDTIIDNAAGSSEPFSACPLRCDNNVPCGSDIGECTHGEYICTNGNLDTSVCVGQQEGTPEVCDNKDNDCDGIVDNPSVLARPCNTPWGSTGICVPGVQYCAKPSELGDDDGYHVDAQGQPVCDGHVDPETRELCDELDHDCDGNPFTCTQLTCESPDIVGVGDACGQGIGSCTGTQYCDMTSQPPMLRCNAAGGSPEICDGLDNDCDGDVDEDLGPQGPCGSGRGECRPGNYECDTNLGKRVCIGAIGPTSEICDALDNDCDGKVDEGIGLGESCGESEGRCEPGKLVCQGGRTVCSGDIEPQRESCDCTDNDCDGKTDEATGDSAVCPGASVCTRCQCALPCAPTQEFIAQCPQGKAPVTENGECFCVAELCNDNKCAAQTIEQDGVTQCAPDSDEVGTCVCQDNVCVARCAGVTCNDGLACDRTDGRCKQSSCLLPQFKCPTGQHCVLIDQRLGCEDDPCAGRECEADQACKSGECVKSCGAVRCETGKRCVDGECVADRCTSSCALVPEVCDPETGECVTAEGFCSVSGCPRGQVCSAVRGDCEEDPCLRIACPVGERCVPESGQCEQRCADGRVFCDGDCINPSADRRFCGASGDCTSDRDGERCTDGLVCSLGACSDRCADSLVNCDSTCIDPQSDGLHCGAHDDCQGVNAGQLCGATQTCERGRCQSLLPPDPEDLVGVVATGGGGCSCSVGPGSQAGAPRGIALGLFLFLCVLRFGRRRIARLAPLLIACALVLSGCDTRAFKLRREDRDAGGGGTQRDASLVDSGYVVGRDSGQSQRGDAQITDGQAADACLAQELCNGKDDDCDGTTDEDPNLDDSRVDIQNDPLNCGSCGSVCAIEHAFNTCKEGRCAIDRGRGEQGCDIGFHDLDNNADNGCEYGCSRTADNDSQCDLLDNDCDGKTDEDVDLEVDVANCGNCGIRCEFLHAADAASCAGGKCQLDSSRCDDGFRDVDGRPGTGCEYRCPTAFSDEVCNSLDDDCDGQVDEDIQTQADSRIGVACGTDTGECRQGTTICREGSPACSGQLGATPERCDSKDNNCDGVADDGFDLMVDKAHCGSCNHACVFSSSVSDGHAVLLCVQGMCQVAERGCIGNWSDRNGDYRDGCETACTFTSEEYCDNVDNDCNGVVDDDVRVPDVVCAARETGVCMSNLAELRANGPQCRAGVLSCSPASTNIVAAEDVETLCDSLDNDCDGSIDEMIPAVGQPCTRGTGACMTTGVFVCDDDQQGPGYRCNADPPGTATVEACNGLDDDCDGTVDDLPPPTPTTSVPDIEVVNLGNNVLMMAYEASRPDATQSSVGSRTTRPCSAPNRLPWADVTWQEANTACCALNASGECENNESGWRLCDADTWEDGCAAASGTCDWSYSNDAICAHDPAVTTHTKLCLGAEAAADPSIDLMCSGDATQCATYSGRFEECYADWGDGDRLFDLSGNVREWTHTEISAQVHAIRGGGYTNFEAARSCTFDFNAGDETFHFPSTGFRCCYYP